MAANFKVGDVVQLKGGGELMTVIEVDGDYVTCTWHDKGKRQDATYPADALMEYKGEGYTLA